MPTSLSLAWVTRAHLFDYLVDRWVGFCDALLQRRNRGLGSRVEEIQAIGESFAERKLIVTLRDIPERVSEPGVNPDVLTFQSESDGVSGQHSHHLLIALAYYPHSGSGRALCRLGVHSHILFR